MLSFGDRRDPAHSTQPKTPSIPLRRFLVPPHTHCAIHLQTHKYNCVRERCSVY